MDMIALLRTLGGLGIVLGMLATALWIVRRYDIALPGRRGGGTAGRRRIELVERVQIDQRRSVVLLRRDDREHLFVLNPESATVLETRILRCEEEAGAEDAMREWCAARGARGNDMWPERDTDVPKSVGSPVRRSNRRHSLVVPSSCHLPWQRRIVRPATLTAIAVGIALIFGPGIAHAAVVNPAASSVAGTAAGSLTTLGATTLSGRAIQLVLMLTVLSLAPGILMTVTSFTRIVVALSLLRSGLGAQGVPPNPVIISLALFLSFFVMAPTFDAAWTQGVKPYSAGQITEQQAFERTAEPFREFMLGQVRDDDLRLFNSLAKTPAVPRAQTKLATLMPAFMISELRRAFEIGFLLLLPFLVIDLAVAAVLMAMGMMMLPPPTISLPCKIIFFVLVDGWALVAGSLVKSFGT